MPAYEYSCRDCGAHFERRQKMSEPEISSCPSCGGAVKRLISGGAGAITKGASASAARPCGMGGGACEMPTQMGCGGGCACAH
ncbi:FmdB family zinc ribbon protein [Occallatibacter riparius]|uniref:Zinc ribbon domain-containing protein n=1 Tax=Occallatibacter riparius TaxID=1002689 RepID=A0A9J7BSK3_9BACT|nr:zinc ribbon domain-containing protein [Occallatibacter riparius]UWZ85640.1 zinc ribbon domain-containing protein [Occallatibacter riparius]